MAGLIGQLQDLAGSWVFLLVSALAFVLTLIAVPWLILQLPDDYFLAPKRQRLMEKTRQPLVALLLLLVKNMVGIVVILLGVAMLVLPGQGLLTILVGLMLLDFPGKFRLERWLVSRRTVFRGINWLRDKRGRPPIRLEEEPVRSED